MDEMQKLIYDTLGRPELDKINFNVEGTLMICVHFWGVRNALKNNTIRAEHDRTLGTRTAKYSFKYNKFRLGYKATAGDADLEALIVHEATHAALDLCQQNKRLRVSEGVAYIAQCLYFYQRNKSKIDSGSMDASAGGTDVLTAAWELSKKVRTPNAPLTRQDMKPLYDALDKHPQYKGKLDEVEQMDG